MNTLQLLLKLMYLLYCSSTNSTNSYHYLKNASLRLIKS